MSKIIKKDYSKFNRYIEIGKKYFEQRDYSSALEQYNKILKQDSQNKEAHFEIGKTYFVLKNYPMATKFLKEAIELEPRNEHTHMLLAKVYMAQEKFDVAIEELRKIEAKSQNWEVHFELGLIYQRIEDYDSAINSLKKVQELCPEDERIHMELGRIYWVKGDGDKALNEFKKVLSYNSAEGIIHIEMGHSTKSKSEEHSGIEELLEAYRFGPDKGKIILDLAELQKTGKGKLLSVKEQENLTRIKSIRDPFVRNKMLNKWELSQGRIVLESKPLGLLVTLTHKCNLRCSMCNIGDPSWDITRRTVEEIKEYIPYLQEIRWQGGEVLLSDYFGELFDEARRFTRISHSIVTNGLLINEEWAEKFANSNVDLITFSIDGVTKEVYEKIRKGGSFEKLLENLRILNKYRKKFPNKTKTMLNAVVMKSNFHQLNEFLEFAKKYGFNYLQISPIETITGPENIFANLDQETLEYIQKVMPELLVKSKKYNIILYNCLPIPFNDGEVESEKEIRYSEFDGAVPLNKELLCYLPWQYLSINYGGQVSPHCSCRKKVGSVDEYTLDELWNGDMMQLYRKMILENKYRNICNLQCITNVVPKEYRRLG